MNLVEDESGTTFDVWVVPRSSRSEIVGVHDGVVKVKLNAPPVDGAANNELVKVIAKRLGISKSATTIVTGETSRTKRLKAKGVTAAKVRDAFEAGSQV